MSSLEIELHNEVIRLGQLLQLAGLVDSGSEAKAVLASGEVEVNGEAESRRGRQIRPGDVVAAFGQVIVVRGPNA